MALLHEVINKPKLVEFSVEQKNLLPEWRKINQVTLSGSLIPKIAEILCSKNSDLTIYTSDQVYFIGSGRPIFKREVSFVSKNNFYPGFVVQHQEAARVQPYVVKFTLNTFARGDSEFEEIDLVPKVQDQKPYWWPQNYRFKVNDLTNPHDILRPGKLGGTHIYHSEDFTGPLIEFPKDADISYLWERNKTHVNVFLEEIERRLIK